MLRELDLQARLIGQERIQVCAIQHNLTASAGTQRLATNGDQSTCRNPDNDDAADSVVIVEL